MKVNRFNIIQSIGNKYILSNFLFRNIDIISESDIKLLNTTPQIHDTPERERLDYFLKQGYISEYGTEDLFIKQLCQQFLQNKNQIPWRILIIPSYTCNLNCGSCYFKDKEKNIIDLELIDSMFLLLNNISSNQPIQIGIYGGEPLINNPEHKMAIEYILSKTQEIDCTVQIFTNGIELNHYIEILCKYKKNIYISVSLIGSKEIHNQNRNNTFDKIIDNIDKALEHDLYINLHLLTNSNTSEYLVDFVNMMIDRLWHIVKSFNLYFRPVQSFECSCPDISDINKDLTGSFLNLKKEFPQLELVSLKEWHGLDIIENIIRKKELPFPVLYRCRSEVNFLAFDPLGNIYNCYNALGNPDYSIGKYFPEYKIFDENFKFWTNKSLIEPSKCLNCVFFPLCGGGCRYYNILNKHPLFSNLPCKDIINHYLFCIDKCSNDIIKVIDLFKTI